MDCLNCKNLEEAFESRLSKYIEARSAAYYQVSTELAAKKYVDMERARNDLEEHQLICVSAAAAKRHPWLPEAVAIMRDRSLSKNILFPTPLEYEPVSVASFCPF